MKEFIVNPCLKGEFILLFSIRIEGFFAKETMNPILFCFEKQFQTSDVSNQAPENVNADAIRLKDVLERFTESVYEEVEDELNNTEDVITTDPLFF